MNISMPPALSLEAPFETRRLSTMRRGIGRRLTEAKQTIPHFYLSIDLEIDRVLEARVRINSGLVDEKVSVNDFLVRAAALALIKVPAVNAQIVEDELRLFSRSDVAVAVAIKDGLVAPVVRGACGKNLLTLSREIRAMADRANRNKLGPDDYQGGTFTVSNLGSYGVTAFTAIVNPPHAAILALGRAEARAVVRNGTVVPATMLTATLSADHRIIDGVVGAQFLEAIKELVDAPEGMLA